MKRLPKIKVENVNDGNLKKVKDLFIQRCRIVYTSFPAATKLYVAMKASATVKFVSDNWQEITNH